MAEQHSDDEPSSADEEKKGSARRSFFGGSSGKKAKTPASGKSMFSGRSFGRRGDKDKSARGRGRDDDEDKDDDRDDDEEDDEDEDEDDDIEDALPSRRTSITAARRGGGGNVAGLVNRQFAMGEPGTSFAPTAPLAVSSSTCEADMPSCSVSTVSVSTPTSGPGERGCTSVPWMLKGAATCAQAHAHTLAF